MWLRITLVFVLKMNYTAWRHDHPHNVRHQHLCQYNRLAASCDVVHPDHRLRLLLPCGRWRYHNIISCDVSECVYWMCMLIMVIFNQGWVQLHKITSITITIIFKYQHKLQLQLHLHNVILNYNYNYTMFISITITITVSFLRKLQLYLWKFWLRFRLFFIICLAFFDHRCTN